jgi:carbon starvation protein
MWILLMALTLVLAVFGLVIAAVFRQFPMAIFPCLVQIPLAMAIGGWLHRRGSGILGASLATLVLMYVSVVAGDAGWLHTFNQSLAQMPVWAWTVLLLLYCYAASVLPVWLLLQPRDFINSLQLLSTLGLLVVGLVVAASLGGAAPAGAARPPLEIVAPAIQWNPPGAPMMFPFLFITIACGAVSGFHCLVSSGTSSKQLSCESHATFVGYGSMLTEGFLAILVILACVAGLGLGLNVSGGITLHGVEAWKHQYANWGQAESLNATIGAFVAGGGNLLAALGIPKGMGTALMGVFVASFAGTTMDSACRLQRYVVQEVIASRRTDGGDGMGAIRKFFSGSHGATLLAITSAGLLAAMPPPGLTWSLENAGRGGMILWPLFGATNQLVAGIAFIVIVFYVRSTGKPVWFLLPPMFIMLVMPLWAMGLQLFVGSGNKPGWLQSGNLPLVLIAGLTMALEIWLILEAWLLWRKKITARDLGGSV